MLPPGDKSTISFKTHMGQGMEGPHLFEIVVKTNDREEPQSILRVRGNFH